MLEGRYRQLTELGAFQVGAYLTHGSRLRLDEEAGADRNRGIRAYLEGNGRFRSTPSGR
jgi:LPS-assembly protein